MNQNQRPPMTTLGLSVVYLDQQNFGLMLNDLFNNQRTLKQGVRVTLTGDIVEGSSTLIGDATTLNIADADLLKSWLVGRIDDFVRALVAGQSVVLDASEYNRMMKASYDALADSFKEVFGRDLELPYRPKTEGVDADDADTTNAKVNPPTAFESQYVRPSHFRHVLGVDWGHPDGDKTCVVVHDADGNVVYVSTHPVPKGDGQS